MPKIELTSSSFRHGASGEPGDVIECSDADATYLLEAGAGKRVDSFTNFVAPAAPEASISSAPSAPAPAVAAADENPKRASK